MSDPTPTPNASSAPAPDTFTPNVVQNSTLLIGLTGSGKSTLLATAAEYVYEKYGKVTQYNSADPGGFPAKVQGLIKLGIIRLFRLRTRGDGFMFETCQLSSKGYVPKVVRDPLTGSVDPGVQMIPPYSVRFSQYCGSCQGLVRSSSVEAALRETTCPHCSRPVTPLTHRIKKEATLTRGYEHIGLTVFDSISSFCDWGLMDLAQRMDLGGEMGALGGTVESGNLKFRANNRSQVGFIQTRAYEFIVNANSIPGQVMAPIWTAWPDDASDSDSLPVIGPKLAGSAKTASAAGWFGNVFEVARVKSAEQQGREVVRLYLSEFIDPQNRRHLLKHRSDPTFMPAYVEDPAVDPAHPDPTLINSSVHLGRVFEMINEGIRRQEEAAVAKFGDNVPGVPAQLTYGDESDLAGAAPVATQAKTAGRTVAVRKPPVKGKTAPATTTPAAAAQETPSVDTTPVQPAGESPAPREETPAAAGAPAAADSAPGVADVPAVVGAGGAAPAAAGAALGAATAPVTATPAAPPIAAAAGRPPGAPLTVRRLPLVARPPARPPVVPKP